MEGEGARAPDATRCKRAGRSTVRWSFQVGKRKEDKKKKKRKKKGERKEKGDRLLGARRLAIRIMA